MGKTCLVLLAFLGLLIHGSSSVSASSTTRIVTGVVNNVASTIIKRLWSLKPPTKTAIPSRSMMKFEGGYTVETVFDGSKLGIEPHSLGISAEGDILILDSENSNIYSISNPLSRYSRPKLLTGSVEGHAGHVDARLRDARMNHPKGLTVDDSGNVYVADTMNMAIRKITNTGVVTIAGGKSGRGGHVDGPSEDAKFSDDFDVVYVGSSCSLLVVDRGNRAIREIQLREDDCAHHEEDINLHLGIAVLAAACFFGYMLALLQTRIASILRSKTEMETYVENTTSASYQSSHPPRSMRPPLIPPDGEYEKQEEGLFTATGKLILSAGSSFLDIFIGLVPSFRKKTLHHVQHLHHHRHHSRIINGDSPVPETFIIPRDDEPPPVEPRGHTPRRSYPVTTKVDAERDKSRHFKQSRGGGYSRWDRDYQQQQQRHLQHQKHQPSRPQTYYEPQRNDDEPNEIVFGAVQEQDGRREAMVIKAVDYRDPFNTNQNVRSRYNYMSYAYGY